MNLNEITTEAVMALNPCDVYSRERVEALVQRLSTETPFEVLLSIPFDNALWFIARILPVPERVQWAEACASRAKEYAEGAADARAAYWAADAVAADAAYWATYWAAAKVAAYASRAANYAGGKAAQRAEQHLAIRHGLMLLEGM